MQQQQANADEQGPDWIGQWISETGAIPTGAAPTGSVGQSGGIYGLVARHVNGSVLYVNILNCPNQAFHTALETYEVMQARYGASSIIVTNWLEAQTLVFDNCGVPGQIPAQLSPTAPAIARADRAYQIAAAHFYAGNYDQAASEFRAIGEDASSPWHAIAPYLVARALVRKAVVSSFEPNLTVLAQAETQLNAVLADPRQAKYRRAAELLRGFVEFRLHPRDRLAELANRLTRREGDWNLAQDAIDFERLSHIVTQRPSWGIPPPVSPTLYSSLAEIRAKSDLLDWIITLRLNAPEAYNHSLERWARSRSPAWLVAALTKADPDSPHLTKLMSAARSVPQSAPAYESVLFQRLRLMTLEGNEQQVREQLAHINVEKLANLPALNSAPSSTLNLFLALRFKLARNARELFASAPRVAVTITSGDSSKQMPQPIWVPGNYSFDPSAPQLDGDGLVVFNRLLPISVLAQAARTDTMPSDLREQIALAAWTRAALLGDAAVARSVAPSVGTFEPHLTATLRAYSSARSPAARRFAAAFAILQFPGLSPFITTPERWTPIDTIDDYRNNWWGTLGPACAPSTPSSNRFSYPPPPQWPIVGDALLPLYPSGKVSSPSFLTPSERTEANREWRELLTDSPAPDYLAKQVLTWAKAHPADPRDAEALARAVKATRVGCADQATGTLSKAAFDLLRQRYPRSSWANQTPYWFKM
ncbi:MAG: hypothetical protein ACRD11_03950 [Terriglobia bacterium]